MVRHLDPSWRVVEIDRIDDGVNETTRLDVETPTERRRVVLKASTSSSPLAETRAQVEPRMISLVGRSTEMPVPSVSGVCDDHETYPTPFFVMSHVDGETFDHARASDLPPHTRETIFREAGENLAQLHALGPLPAVGELTYRDGDVTILDTTDHPRYDDFHDWLLDTYEETLDRIEEDGGYFPDLTEDPTRFTDLVPGIRQYLRETIPDLPSPEPPTYCHKDYRYGNVAVDPETGATRAVLDWGILMSAPPAFNIAMTESKLLKPDYNDDADPDTGRAGALRQILRDAYAETRTQWTFDEETRERIRLYRLVYRLDAMACLPLWYRTDPTLSDRDTRAAEHRAFVEQYL
ncbi:phosphotransferase [Haloferax sp. MBLA0076]|uniref:Phosphotransferase n=2 Tax=Haloferacaceae TaxID=1644056 RepID=A0A6A8GIH3_9EURY|nr:phosphotransferase [Haloferax sp. CBA1148]MRX22756.1 phosphotransferase [Haloferax litoreum]